jgi:hypothetical protein
LIMGSLALDHDIGARDLSVFNNYFSGPQPDATISLLFKDNSLFAPPHPKKLKITIMVLADPKSLKRYENNLMSLECYAKLQGYSFIAQDASESCRSTIDNFFFLKHCTVLEQMQLEQQESEEGETVTTDSWFLVLDADNAVVNFNHRIEEYIQKGGKDKDVIHGLRFHNNEVTASNYLVHNTKWGRDYLQEWISLHPGNSNTHHQYGGMNHDNGALHWLLLHRLGNETIDGWSQCQERGKETKMTRYSEFVKCFHNVLKRTGCRNMDWPHVAILPHGEHVSYDTWITYNYWSNHTFMHHAMKPGNPPDRTCCKRPIMNPVMPKFDCTREVAFSRIDQWYVDPNTYGTYKQEARVLESSRQNVGSWDTSSCLQNGQLDATM